MIRNIVFDIGMVLADFRWRDYMEKDLGFPQDVVELFAERLVLNPLWDEYDLGVRETEDIIAEMKAAVPGHREEADRVFANIVDIAEAYPYSTAWIRGLQERGFKVYLLSNYPRDTFALHEKYKFDFVKYADGKVVSGFERISKPDPRIYRLLFSRYGLKAEECVFIDDREVNIEAAIAEGMQGIRFLSYEQACAELEDLISRG